MLAFRMISIHLVRNFAQRKIHLTSWNQHVVNLLINDRLSVEVGEYIIFKILMGLFVFFCLAEYFNEYAMTLKYVIRFLIRWVNVQKSFFNMLEIDSSFISIHLPKTSFIPTNVRSIKMALKY